MTQEIMLDLRQQLLLKGIPTVIIGELVALAPDGVAIRPVDGYPSTRFFGQVALDEPLVEVLLRNKSYVTLSEWAKLSHDALDNYSNSKTGILSSLITGSPGYLGANEKGFHEWHMITHLTLCEK